MAEALIPIVQRAYDFAVNLYGAVNRFPRARTSPSWAGSSRGWPSGSW